MRRALVLCLIALAGCGETAADPESCEVDARLLDKRWFVGDLVDPSDNPVFTATAALVDVQADGEHQPVLSTQPKSHSARFEVIEDMLLMREAAGGDEFLLMFPIVSHREKPCHDANAYNPDPYDVGNETPNTVPWFERSWMLIDWSFTIEPDSHRVDAASAAGLADFVEYEPIAVYQDPEHPLELALDEGWMAVTVTIWIIWQDLDDGSPSCALDFPTLPPGAECPIARVKIRWQLERN